MDAALWAAWLESSSLGEWMRTSGTAYPAVNLVHLAGLILLIGPMLLLDLRLLGVGRSMPLPESAALLTPLAVTGLILLLISGSFLFAADASPLLSNPLFLPKLICIALGVANAVVFRVLWSDRIDGWDTSAPLAGRLQAFASMGLWILAAVLGRLLAYV